MGEVVTQSVTIEKWPEGKSAFETPQDLFDCLSDLVDAGHRGQVRAIIVDGEPRWDLEINTADETLPQPFVRRPGFGGSLGDQGAGAVLGQCVVLIGDVVEVMTPEQYGTRFETTARAAKRSAKKGAAK